MGGFGLGDVRGQLVEPLIQQLVQADALGAAEGLSGGKGSLQAGQLGVLVLRNRSGRCSGGIAPAGQLRRFGGGGLPPAAAILFVQHTGQDVFQVVVAEISHEDQLLLSIQQKAAEWFRLEGIL